MIQEALNALSIVEILMTAASVKTNYQIGKN